MIINAILFLVNQSYDIGSSINLYLYWQINKMYKKLF